MMVIPPRRRFAGAILALAVLALLPNQNASASMLTIVAPSPVLLPGQSETISVRFTSTQAFTLGAADIEIAYDSTRFSASNVMSGTLDPSPAFSVVSNVTSPGLVLTSISFGNSVAGTPIANGQVGTLETFTLTALGNAPAGGATGDINLLANSPVGLGTVTAVYDSFGATIGLNPAPTNGFDAGVDGTVGVVPEPASILMMGLGGGLIAVAARFRKKARRASAPAA